MFLGLRVSLEICKDFFGVHKGSLGCLWVSVFYRSLRGMRVYLGFFMVHSLRAGCASRYRAQRFGVSGGKFCGSTQSP